MRFTDSRAAGGPGVLILRHEDHDNQYSVHMRPSIMAVRVKRRADDEDEFGDYEYAKEDVGDLTNCFLWHHDPDFEGSGSVFTLSSPNRRMGGWSWAWAAIVGSDKEESEKEQDCDSKPRCSKRPDQEDNEDDEVSVYPIILDQDGKKMGPDKRFKGLTPALPEGFPKPPTGTVGVLLSDSNEAKMRSLFLPSSNQALIAVHAAGDRDMGTLVWDTTKCYELDEERTAPLQSALWVIKKKKFVDSGGGPPLADLGTTNFLALNLNLEGCARAPDEKTVGGAIIDVPGSQFFEVTRGTVDTVAEKFVPPGPEERVIGMLSYKFGGPFYVSTKHDEDEKRDRHWLEWDGEQGDPLKKRLIGSAHIHSNAYYIKPLGGPKGPTECADIPEEEDCEPLDGPLKFEGFRPRDLKMKKGPYSTMVHLEYWEKELDKFVVTGGGLAVSDEEGATGTFETGACIRHPFVDTKRTGEWRWRAEATNEEGEDGGQGGSGGGDGGGEP